MLYPFALDNIPYGEIRPSAIHGWGLFALSDIPAGTTLVELDGQKITYKQYKSLMSECDDDIFVSMLIEWNCIGNENNEKDIEENTYLVFRPLRTKYSYINHSNSPNCKVLFNPLRVVTIKDVKQNQELTLDYTDEPLPDVYFEEERNSYLL